MRYGGNKAELRPGLTSATTCKQTSTAVALFLAPV